MSRRIAAISRMRSIAVSMLSMGFALVRSFQVLPTVAKVPTLLVLTTRVATRFSQSRFSRSRMNRDLFSRRFSTSSALIASSMLIPVASA